MNETQIRDALAAHTWSGDFSTDPIRIVCKCGWAEVFSISAWEAHVADVLTALPPTDTALVKALSDLADEWDDAANAYTADSPFHVLHHAHADELRALLSDAHPGDDEGEAYEPAEFYKVQDLADWLHLRLEGRPYCAFNPKSLCPHERSSRELAEALLCKDGWIEGFMYHRRAARAAGETGEVERRG